jgi:hypothetical protein
MLDVIKSVRICDTFNLSLVYFHTIKGYEVQYSNDDIILDTDGIYGVKRDGLKAFNDFLKSLIKQVQ